MLILFDLPNNFILVIELRMDYIADLLHKKRPK